MALFNRDLELELIKLIKLNPVLYDSTHTSFIDTDRKELVWQQIGEALKKPADACKHNWNNIKRDIKAKAEKVKSATILKSEYENEISFLVPFFEEKILQENSSMEISKTKVTNKVENDNETNHAHKHVSLIETTRPNDIGKESSSQHKEEQMEEKNIITFHETNETILPNEIKSETETVLEDDDSIMTWSDEIDYEYSGSGHVIAEVKNEEEDGETEMSQVEEDINVKLIRLVKVYPSIYSARNRKQVSMKTVWQEIGKTLDIPAESCKSRWVNIRDHMRRKVKKDIASKRIHGKLFPLHKYKYEDELSFIIPFMMKDFDGYENCTVEDIKKDDNTTEQVSLTGHQIKVVNEIETMHDENIAISEMNCDSITMDQDHIKIVDKAFDLNLIKFVKNYPILYKYEESTNTDFFERHKVWCKIGEELDKPAESCRARWVNIRDHMRRKVKKDRAMRRIHGQFHPLHKYKYEDELSFIIPFMNRDRYGYEKSTEDDIQDDDNATAVEINDTVYETEHRFKTENETETIHKESIEISVEQVNCDAALMGQDQMKETDEEFDLKLIRLVKNNPILYKCEESNNTGFIEKQKVWCKIGDELDKPAQHCKERWVSIRDHLRRTVRERSKKLQDFEGCSYRQYKYENELSFIIPYMRGFKSPPVVLFTYTNSDRVPKSSEQMDEAGLSLTSTEQSDNSDVNEISEDVDIFDDPEPSRHFERKLINLVKKNPILYQSNNRRQSVVIAKEKIWRRIGSELNEPVVICKSRWNHIKTSMRRKLKQTSKSKQNEYSNIKYRYEKDLSFVIPYLKDSIDGQRKCFEANAEDPLYGDDDDICMDTNDSINPVGDHYESETETYSSITEGIDSIQHSKSTRTMTATNREESNVLEKFLETVAATLKNLNPYYLNQAKSKIFQVMQDCELQQILNKGEIPPDC